MQYLDYENYRHITFKWHFKLTKALVVLLESKDYMQVCVSIYTPSLSCNKTLLKLHLHSIRQDMCVTYIYIICTLYNILELSNRPYSSLTPSPSLHKRCVMV